MAKFKWAPLGSISHGTLREEDLIDSFMDTLDTLAPRRAAAIRREYEHLFATLDAGSDLTPDLQETASYLVNETLADALNEYAAPYMYFGATEGDGSDFGFWISDDALREAEHDGAILRLASGDPWPKGTGKKYEYVLEVTDHGNMTLYNARSHKEVWSCV